MVGVVVALEEKNVKKGEVGADFRPVRVSPSDYAFRGLPTKTRSEVHLTTYIPSFSLVLLLLLQLNILQYLSLSMSLRLGPQLQAIQATHLA